MLNRASWHHCCIHLLELLHQNSLQQKQQQKKLSHVHLPQQLT
jgi:hypothetical protein